MMSLNSGGSESLHEPGLLILAIQRQHPGRYHPNMGSLVRGAKKMLEIGAFGILLGLFIIVFYFLDINVVQLTGIVDVSVRVV